MAGIVGTLAAAVIAFAVLAVAGYAMPNWLVLVATLAFAKGLVALGIVVLMRGGLVSFGQGTFYCAGAYAAGMAMRSFGIGDAALLVALGAIAGLILGAIIAPLLAGYRGKPPADRKALEAAAMALGRFYLDHRARIEEIATAIKTLRPKVRNAFSTS